MAAQSNSNHSVLVSVPWAESSAKDVESKVIEPIEAALLRSRQVGRLHSMGSDGIARLEVTILADSATSAIQIAQAALSGVASALPETAGTPSFASGTLASTIGR